MTEFPREGIDQMACLQSARIWGCSKTVSQVDSTVSAEVRIVYMLALLSLQKLTSKGTTDRGRPFGDPSRQRLFDGLTVLNSQGV